MSIPQTNPKANYLAHKAEIDAAIAAVLDRGWYILGREVEAFEQEFAAYLGVKQAVGVASGTDALHLALRACGVGAGDAVATVSHTAVATVAAIELAGAVPVWVDIDPATYTMDTRHLKAVVLEQHGPRLKAIIPVHLYGHPANMPDILEVAEGSGLKVVEDCAQSVGAEIQGRRTGGWGHVAAFSFYPTKNLGALGDGGAVATNDLALAERLRLLREYGWRQRYISEVAGLNSRLDELQAAVLRVKLRYLDRENARREELAAAYRSGLAGSSVTMPAVTPGCRHVYHQFAVRVRERASLQSYLRQHDVGTLIHYPVPVHRQPAYERLPPQGGSLAITEQVAHDIVSLPMYPELSNDQVQSVAHLIRQWESGLAVR
jgi:dTDP-4-amino-4,6-dideoxygalactose transaminase